MVKKGLTDKYRSYNSSVIEQKGESENGCNEKTKHPNVRFSGNLAHFLFWLHPF